MFQVPALCGHLLFSGPHFVRYTKTHPPTPPLHGHLLFSGPHFVRYTKTHQQSLLGCAASWPHLQCVHYFVLGNYTSPIGHLGKTNIKDHSLTDFCLIELQSLWVKWVQLFIQSINFTRIKKLHMRINTIHVNALHYFHLFLKRHISHLNT